MENIASNLYLKQVKQDREHCRCNGIVNSPQFTFIFKFPSPFSVPRLWSVSGPVLPNAQLWCVHLALPELV